jgi:hypothetical protein
MRDLEMTAKGYDDIGRKDEDQYVFRPMKTCLDCNKKFYIGNGHTYETEAPFCYTSACRNSFTHHVWKISRRSEG